MLLRHHHHHHLHHPRPLLSFSFSSTLSHPQPHPSLSFLSIIMSSSSSSSTSPPPTTTTTKKKKPRRGQPESDLKHKLDMCSKRNDLAKALQLYDDARVKGIPLSLHHYNSLLYLCSRGDEEGNGIMSSERGFEVFEQMVVAGVQPNEASFTSLARFAAMREDPETAFEVVRRMKVSGIAPRLRSYWPALEGFCGKGMAERVYEVDGHMRESGVVAEEPELRCVLRASVDAKHGDKVYEVLHQLRETVRQVGEDTARILEEWFGSEAGGEVGLRRWDKEMVRKGVAKGGGGWHGQGWLGTGKWNVVRTQMDDAGVCCCCREKLICIDIDPKETEGFLPARSRTWLTRKK
ncbi:hypothetical protein Drorol1_Dr00012770 [Drosera rotundifolia]